MHPALSDLRLLPNPGWPVGIHRGSGPVRGGAVHLRAGLSDVSLHEVRGMALNEVPNGLPARENAQNN